MGYELLELEAGEEEAGEDMLDREYEFDKLCCEPLSHHYFGTTAKLDGCGNYYY